MCRIIIQSNRTLFRNKEYEHSKLQQRSHQEPYVSPCDELLGR
nr:MAG TPA: hypothetical protein [Caudoviricetes sp.]